MRFAKRFLATVCVGIAVTAAGCAHLVIRDVRVSGDGWTLLIDTMTDGPDSFAVGGMPATNYSPPAGERFFRVRVSLRNDAPTAREFNFDRCDLDAPGGEVRVPGLISTAPFTSKADHVETINPGSSLERWLVFAYPMTGNPTRLSCVPMIVRLPPIAPR